MIRHTFKNNHKNRRRIWLKLMFVVVGLCVLGLSGWYLVPKVNLNPNHAVGDIIDEIDSVAVYFNGGVGQTAGRNLAPDGYNLGIKFQCVEFVKRYYYYHYNHKMPDVWGHAISFFEPDLEHGVLNAKRGLIQYHNGADVRPQKGDLVVYAATMLNPYGHVAIVAEVTADAVIIIQQNPGPLKSSRESYPLEYVNGNFKVEHARILGWLRLSL